MNHFNEYNIVYFQKPETQFKLCQLMLHSGAKEDKLFGEPDTKKTDNKSERKVNIQRYKRM